MSKLLYKKGFRKAKSKNSKIPDWHDQDVHESNIAGIVPTVLYSDDKYDYFLAVIDIDAPEAPEEMFPFCPAVKYDETNNENGHRHIFYFVKKAKNEEYKKIYTKDLDNGHIEIRLLGTYTRFYDAAEAKLRLRPVLFTPASHTSDALNLDILLQNVLGNEPHLTTHISTSDNPAARIKPADPEVLADIIQYLNEYGTRYKITSDGNISFHADDAKDGKPDRHMSGRIFIDGDKIELFDFRSHQYMYIDDNLKEPFKTIYKKYGYKKSVLTKQSKQRWTTEQVREWYTAEKVKAAKQILAKYKPTKKSDRNRAVIAALMYIDIRQNKSVIITYNYFVDIMKLLGFTEREIVSKDRFYKYINPVLDMFEFLGKVRTGNWHYRVYKCLVDLTIDEIHELLKQNTDMKEKVVERIETIKNRIKNSVKRAKKRINNIYNRYSDSSHFLSDSLKNKIAKSKPNKTVYKIEIDIIKEAIYSRKNESELIQQLKHATDRVLAFVRSYLERFTQIDNKYLRNRAHALLDIVTRFELIARISKPDFQSAAF